MASRVLLIGYGNPGRLDDGLGPALAEWIERRAIPGVSVDADYQLAVEHAAQVAENDYVIFADAAVRGKEPYSFHAVTPAAGEDAGFSTHSVDPGHVVALARAVFGATTKAYVLAIRGYEFDDFGERLSDGAARNLADAAAFVEGVIRNGLIEDAAQSAGGGEIREAVGGGISAA